LNLVFRSITVSTSLFVSYLQMFDC